MDQALFVGSVKGQAHPVSNAQDCFNAESFLTIKSLSQRLAINELHDDCLTTIIFNGVIHRDDVVVIEIRSSDCFTTKTFGQG